MPNRLASLNPVITLDYTDINPQNVPVQFKRLFKLSIYLGDIHKNQRLCQLKTVPPTNFEMVVCSWLFISGAFSPASTVQHINKPASSK